MTARWNEKPDPGVKPGPAPKNQVAQVAPTNAAGKPLPRPGLDPYVRWAIHTGWRGFAKLAGDDRGLKPDRRIQVIAQAHDDVVLDRAIQSSPLQVSKAYARPVHPGNSRRALHFSASIAKQDLEWLIDNPLRLRWQLALPRRDAERAAKATSNGFFGIDTESAITQGPNVVQHELNNAGELTKAGKLKSAIAVIDFGCAFLHGAFRKGGSTRVAAVWDQGSSATPEPGPGRENGWPWQTPTHFDYGRELGPKAMSTLVRAAAGSRQLEESAIYRGIDYLIDYMDPRRRVWFASHGGHVLDVAGGSPDPLTGNREQPDKAASAPLLFVQLPLLAAMDSGCGALGAHLLDGVRYALSLMADETSPLVVNISYGGQAGPHDGSSLIELAFDELLNARPKNFAIVLAAGNSRQSRGHASRVVMAGRSAMLRLDVPAGDTTDTFVEIWYRRPPAGAHLECRVLTPNHLWSEWVKAGDEIALKDSDVHQDTVALLRHDRTVPNGKRSMMLLALAPTAQPDEVPSSVADAGDWAIEVRMIDTKSGRKKALECTVEAWVERDDPARRSGRGQARFADQTDADERDTRSSIATGQHTVVVGGFNLGTGDSASYSSIGPKGAGTPWVEAVCEEDGVNLSICAAATRSGEVYRLNGTSVAAPVVARRLYNAMMSKSISRTPKFDGYRRALEKMTEDPDESFIRQVRED